MAEQFIIEELGGGVTFEMLLVEGGRFLIGGEDEEMIPRKRLVHEMQILDFYVGKYPFTQEAWKAITGLDQNPSHFKGDSRPAEGVSWQDIQVFLSKLNEITGQSYRLLSEAEWEYAARGGQKSEGYLYSGSNKLKDVGWYGENSYGESKPVGLKYPNELGLYDLSGNVFEWVADHWHNDYDGIPFDGSARQDLGQESSRIIRGGGWRSSSQSCTVFYRGSNHPARRVSGLGFRLGLSL